MSRNKLYRHWAVILGLLLAIAIVYAPVGSFDFVNYDDDLLVFQNPQVQAGLTLDSIRWAFTSVSLFYWQPLAWMSHMLDCQLFGLNPGPPHIVNVGLHALTAVLLFGLLLRMTEAFWNSAFVAALFALHPLRVESVAWISERKDVLSGLLWVLTLWAYYAYTKNCSWRRYLLLLSIFAVALMTKPILMALPAVFLVMDYWPLGRWKPERGIALRLIREKLPFFVLAFVSVLTTLTGLTQMGATADLPLAVRLANATLACVRYLGMLVWPANLSVLYPYRKDIPAVEVVVCAGVLITFTFTAFAVRKRYPYLYAGWLWYIVVLAPTVGLIQSGPQAYADRFTYLPSIGLFIAVVWFVAEKTRRRRPWRIAAISTAAVSIAAFSYVSAAQVQVWRNSVTLFGHAATIVPESAIVQHNLGYALASEGRYGEAIPRYYKALELDPTVYQAHYNLGRALYEQGHSADAIVQLRDALGFKLAPNYESEVRNALGIALAQAGRMDEARSQFETALRLQPQSAAANANLGSLLARPGNLAEAIVHYQAAIQESPGYLEARLNLGQALANSGRRDEALEQFNIVLRQAPGNLGALAGIRQWTSH